MDDLFQSNMDDDLFDDGQAGAGGGTPQVVAPQGNGGQMGSGFPGFQEKDEPKGGEDDDKKDVKPAGKADDNDIMSRLNEMVNPTIPDELQVNENDDVITTMLKKGGINPSAIEIMDENGQPQLVSFSDLSREEQLDMISSIGGASNPQHGDDNAPDLDDEEVDLLNSIRKSNMPVNDFINAIREQAISDYLQSGGNERYYSVDELNDDDLYMSDYKSKVPNATEEEVIAALETAKSNQQVFERTMQGMRETYKQQEEAIHQQNIQQEEARIAAQQQEYESMIVGAVDKMSQIQLGELDVNLSNDDKEQIASAILDKDVTGTRYLAHLLNDPETLSKMVWFALKGDEGINQMQRYYRKEITEKQSAAYKKGFEDAKTGKNMSYTVQRPKGQRQAPGEFRTIGRIEDIDSGID